MRIPDQVEIQNFLSDLEIDHLLQVANEKNMATSTTQAGKHAKVTEQQDSRSSTNTWIGRHQSIITDAIYRRAADVLQIDEKFFRYRRKLEIPEMSESKVGITESLQLVHYDVGQQYVRPVCSRVFFFVVVVSHNCCAARDILSSDSTPRKESFERSGKENLEMTRSLTTSCSRPFEC